MRLEQSELMLTYTTTLHIRDVETGLEERKVWKNGQLMEHVILADSKKEEPDGPASNG